MPPAVSSLALIPLPHQKLTKALHRTKNTHHPLTTTRRLNLNSTNRLRSPVAIHNPPIKKRKTIPI